MNIRIDTDLATRAVAIAKNNGVSATKYVNNLLESALNAETYTARADALEEKRRKVIERAWQSHKFPKHISVEATGGWECNSTPLGSAHFEKVLYYLVKGEHRDSTYKGHFKIAFEDGSAKPGFVVAYDKDGNEF